MDDRCDECGRRKCPTCEQHLEFTLVGEKWLCWMCNNKEDEQSPQLASQLASILKGGEGKAMVEKFGFDCNECGSYEIKYTPGDGGAFDRLRDCIIKGHTVINRGLI